MFVFGCLDYLGGTEPVLSRLLYPMESADYSTLFTLADGPIQGRLVRE